MRTSARLIAIADGLWSVEADVWNKGIHARLRTPVVRLPDGGLWLYSPGPLDEVADELAAIGPVTHLVAPNLNHHKFLAAAHKRYPEAVVWAVAGLAHKRPDLPIERAFSEGNIGADIWGDRLIGCALCGVPFTNEAVFFHRPSSTLICADLVQNIHDEPAWLTRQIWRMIGTYKRLGQNRYWRMRTSGKPAFRASMELVLEWQPKRLMMSHGDIVHEDGAALLAKGLDWLDR